MDGIPYAPGGRQFRCDVNGDGLADMCSSGGLDLAPVDSSPDFILDWADGSPTDTFGGDLDGDGKTEMYLVYSQQVHRFEYVDGEVSGGPVAIWNHPFATSAFAADLDGDGVDSIFARGPSTLIIEATDADFFADTHFDTAMEMPFNLGDAIAGDFDGDGQQEIAYTNNGENAVIIQEYNGTVALRIEPDSPFPVGSFGAVMDSGDADGNGIDDLVIGAPSDEYGHAFFLFDPLCELEP